MRQEWGWIDAARYQATMVLEEETEDGWTEMLGTASRYYAVEIPVGGR